MANYIKINETYSYQKIKALDLESEKKMVEGPGPADECICHILSPHEDRSARGIGGTMRDSIKRAIRSMSGSVKRKQGGGGGGGGWGGMGAMNVRGSGACVNPSCEGNVGRGGGVYIPLTTTKGGKGIYTTKETLKRTKPCGGKCGCDDGEIVMKHAYANIKIITPDVSSICPCPNSCLNTEALNNIKVTVERLELHPDTTDSEASVSSQPPPLLQEPIITKRSISELIDAQYEGTGLVDNTHEVVIGNVRDEKSIEGDDVSEWSFGIVEGGEEEEEEDEEDETIQKQPPKNADEETKNGDEEKTLDTV